ncbi:MAG: uroporphyrinogen-III synthase [Bauldia sp.]
MRLLVTRPEPDAERTAARLRAAGHEVLLQPVQATVLLPEPAPRAPPSAIAVTSRNGVRALAAWRQSARWRHLPLFAVGPGTAKAASEAGFGHVASADGDGAALAGLIRREREPSSGPILYPAAADRSPVLEATLRGAGYEIDTVVAYRMEPVAALDPAIARAFGDRTIDGVLLYSPRSAAAFVDLLGGAGLLASLAAVTIYAISDATAAALRETDVGVKVAERPDEEALLRLLTVSERR